VTALPDGLGAMLTHVDVTRLVRAQHDVSFSVLHDPMTGLPNRTLLDDRLEQQLARSRRHGGQSAVLCVDVDRFQAVNDSVGRVAGDGILVEIARRLIAVVRDKETVARVSGEFVIVAYVFDTSGARTLAHRIVTSMSVPIAVGGDMHLSVPVSVGVAVGGGSIDAGTGYSSLLAVKRFPVAGLKFDRSFVEAMLDSDDDRAIVRSVINLAAGLEIDVVGEGVETPEQMALLTDFGCTHMQGHLWARHTRPLRFPTCAAAWARPSRRDPTVPAGSQRSDFNGHAGSGSRAAYRLICPPMGRRYFVFACTVAAVTGILAVLGAFILELPLRDPDGFVGPAYIRLPAIVLVFLLLDIAPAVFAETRRTHRFVGSVREVVVVRWSLARLGLIITGLMAFYVTYVGYRNLKGFLPFVRDDHAEVDSALHIIDRTLFLGNEPGPFLHDLLGVGASAHVLSWVYVSYLFFVPLSLGAALVWSRDMRRGFWYVTALCLNWSLGVVSYYMLPSQGPVFAYSQYYRDLPETGVSDLQTALLGTRLDVLADPGVSTSIQGIAGFASLHVSVVFTAALFAHKIGAHRLLRYGLWVYLGLTTLSTVYFGWHYLLDDVAGIGIGWFSVALGARFTGHHDRRRRARAARPSVTEHQAVQAPGPGTGAPGVQPSNPV